MPAIPDPGREKNASISGITLATEARFLGVGSMSNFRHIGQVILFLCVLHVSNHVLIQCSPNMCLHGS
jgi:hypothetical protein